MSYQQRAVNTFIKGLITEAGELTFPEGASVDELNCELFRDGSRRRRKAIAFEDNNVNSTFTVSASTVMSFGEWKNVGNNADKQYLVVQAGGSLYFYDKGLAPYSGAEKANSVSLTPYQANTEPGVANARCSFVSILGNLVVVSESLEPIYITEESGGSFTVTEIECLERDFKWLGDKTTYDEEGSSSPSLGRQYDTYNCGWVGDLGSAALSSYQGSNSGNWPPLTHPWYSGKNSSGNFSVSEWDKVYSGTSLIGNGHYILGVFNKDRDTASGLSGLPTSTDTTRFTTATAFASRVFFAGLSSSENAGKVYFSQILQDMTGIGQFYQSNDPTAEDLSDLLESDGGVIVIPDATEIKRLHTFQNSVFVFADNGVWQITGVDNVFNPTAYSVARITEVGILSNSSFTVAEGVPFWWSKQGIHTLSFDQLNNAREQNLTISTIQTFWDNIENSAKERVQATYDRNNKKVFWVYPSNGESTTNKLNNVLVLDVQLQAFYPWTIVDKESSTDYVVGCQFYDGFGTSDIAFNVVSGSDEIVVGADDVVATLGSLNPENAVDVIFFTRDTSESKLTFSRFNSNTYLDWGEANYTSYAETGYDFGGDLLLRKTAPYIVTYLRESEEGWTDNGSGFDEINPSSILVSSYWDFKKTPSSTAQQAYRRKSTVVVDPLALSSFDSEESVITSRLKMRGRGRSMRVRYESEQGKDFILLGHGLIIDTANRF